jgi:hypothetical protein
VTKPDGQNSAGSGQRAPYVAPTLTCHGNAQALTLFDVSNNMNDKSAGIGKT